ncbi:glycerophosphoryl diester phosphodiesterase [Dysgonomonas alginatilytica]|uniref:Glycerophosphoryl diester phosphodiesterase n=1 Tax=Dysgonomonas alginatilytica TaxID=1605892 RepID=A0A2V3PPR6_9BACT|nr:glycerophosphodiester phosphodiesterase family protein [Dysgonomonas alginatilytica]PXV63551.1 glycerophosphoryl diester phosphodiesterase [Dysgonomonas alginatilytica]
MRAQKTISFLLVCMSCLSISARTILPTLDKYTIPVNVKGAVIGKFISSNNENVTLAKDTSNLFLIDESGYIRLKADVELSASSPFRYEIIIKSSCGNKAFELVKDEFIHNKVIAHRGAWKNHEASQNSMSALINTIELGCEAAEFDVWLSSDNKVILSHDPTIGGKVVEDTPARTLMEIPLENGDFVPSLEAYLECIQQQNKTRLVLELKGSQKGKERSLALAESAVQLVHKYKAQAWVDYISFDYEALLHVKQLDPTATISYLETNKTLEELSTAKVDGIDYHYSAFYNDEKLTEKAKQLGLTTNVWTVNTQEQMQHLLQQGVDYITTDEPELLLKFIDTHYK